MRSTASDKAVRVGRARRRGAHVRVSDGLLALVLGGAYVALLLWTVDDLGYARDEGFYFVAANRYGAWFQELFRDARAALDRQAIDAAWSVNHEHPALIKSLFALSNLVLQRRFHLFAMEGTSYRFPAMLLSGVGVALVYLWGSQARDRAAGLAAAALFAMLPRYFYHAHLACFDAPVVTVWMACAYGYWRSLRDGGALWPALTGVMFGLALDTKHNAWFLPIVVVAHALGLLAAERLAERDAMRDDGARAHACRRALAALFAMGTLGPLVFYALWPWIWHDTLARLRDYASFHLNHEYYNMEFLGRNYWIPPMPRAYAFVMTAATVPGVTLALFAAGVYAGARARLRYPCARVVALVAGFGAEGAARRPVAPSVNPGFGAEGAARRPVAPSVNPGFGAEGAARRPVAPSVIPSAVRAWAELVRPAPADPAGTVLLWFLSIAAIYGAWLSPNTPIFGGTKHWMTAYPFVALFAGTAFSTAVRRVRAELRAGAFRGQDTPAQRGTVRRTLARLGRGPLPAVALGAAIVAAPAAETLHAHPWALSSYAPLVGGAAGAATLGLNRTFWGYTTGAVIGYLNKNVPRGGTVYIHDTAGPAWDMLRRDGRLRKDIRGVWSAAGADFALYHHEKHMLGQAYQAWIAYGTSRPDHIGGIDGVPVIMIYRNHGR